MKRIIEILLVVFAVFLFSCQNDEVDIPVEDMMAEKSAQITLTEAKLEAVATETEYEVEFYANAEEVLTRWWKMGKIWRWNNKLRYKVNQCPLVTIEQGENDGYPKIITLNYGEGTVLKNEKVLSGEIVIEITAPRKSKDYTRLVTYTNFGIDEVLISGTSLVTVDKELESFRNFESDFSFNVDEETKITRTSKRSWVWIEGMETTEDQTDDKIQIEGSVNATNLKTEDTYKKEIVKPLIRLGDCRYIVEGIVEISLNGTTISSLNYGEGECNAVAIVTKDGETKEVDLAKHKMKKDQNKDQSGNN